MAHAFQYATTSHAYGTETTPYGTFSSPLINQLEQRNIYHDDEVSGVSIGAVFGMDEH